MATVRNAIDKILQAATTRTTNLVGARVRIKPSAYAFHVTAAGANDPASITVNADLTDLEGAITFSASGGTLTSVTANSAALTYANMSAVPAAITATVISNGQTYSDTCFITKVLDGVNGVNGSRGAGHFYAAGSAWSDATAEATTPGANITDDVVTISSGTFVMEKRWDGAAWVAMGTVINGNLLVDGSVIAAKITTNGLIVRAIDGTPIVGIGVPLNPAYAAPGTKNNEIDLSWWKAGATIPWATNSGVNSIATTSGLASGTWAGFGPRGGSDLMWYAKEDASDSGPGGGWEAPSMPLDPTRTYRFVVPILRRSGSGTSYWGPRNVCNLNTSTENPQPYFANASIPADKWFLFVGFIFPSGSVGNTNAGAGIYDCTTGGLFAAGLNFCFKSGDGSVAHRAYQFDATLNSEQIIGRPMINVVDGTEPALSDYFTYGKSAYDAIPGINTAIADKLSKTSASNLAATVTLTTGGSILSGTPTNGTYQSPSGFYGVQGGVVKFSVPISGDPTFAGQLTAPYGTFGAVSIAAGGSLGIGATGYNTDAGIWLGYVGANPKMSVRTANGATFLFDPANNVLAMTNVALSNPTIPAITVTGLPSQIGGTGFANSGWVAYATLTATPGNGQAPYAIDWTAFANEGGIKVDPASGPTTTVYGRGSNMVVDGYVSCVVRGANGLSGGTSVTVKAAHGSGVLA